LVRILARAHGGLRHGGAFEGCDDAAIDFLDATLAGRGPGVSALPRELSSSSLEQLQVAR